MISDGTYEEFECALSIDRHFVKDPIILTSCGHATCKKCLPKTVTNLICGLCCSKINKDLRNEKSA